MKKAKIMLMAIAVVGIAGGAFAFKAHKTGNLPVFSCDALNTRKCVLPAGAVQATTIVNENPIVLTISPDQNQACDVNDECPTTVYFLQ